MLEELTIGQIVNTHGISGEIKVYPLTDNMKRFSKVKEVYVETENELKKFEVQHVKYLKNTVIVKLIGIETPEDAQKLLNLYIKIDRNKAAKLPKDSYFICDLIGIEVYDINGEYLGKVADLMQTGSNDVYVVKSDEREILIPGLKSVFKEINIADRKIIVELPEGLI